MTCTICGGDAECLEFEFGPVCVDCLGDAEGEAAGTRPDGRPIACYVKRPENCWIPEGRGRAEDGRVVVRMAGKKAYLYNVVWSSLMGEIPEGMTPDHLCLEPSCVNPTHIEWVTREENASRSWTRGRRRK